MSRIERGLYRSAYCALVESAEWQALPPDSRNVFWALKFSPLGNVAGIFVLYLDALERHTGIRPRRRLLAALDELEQGAWIVREGAIVWIRNALKFDPSYSLEQEEKRKGILNMLGALPRQAILSQFCEYYGLEAPPDWPRRMTPPLNSTPGGPPGGGHPTPEGPPRDPRAGVTRPPRDPRGTTARGSAGAVTGSGERTGEREISAPQTGASRSDLLAEFPRFWEAWPGEKVGKGRAEEKFIAARRRGVTLAELLAAVIRWEEDRAARRGRREFVPEYCHPATWLQQRRWEDAPATAPPAPATTMSRDSWLRQMKRIRVETPKAFRHIVTGRSEEEVAELERELDALPEPQKETA